MTNKIPQGNDRIDAPSIYISEYDLKDEDIQLCIEALGLDEVLYQIGFDKEHWFESSNTFYEVMDCEHITRGGKRVKGKRYSSVERLDQQWLDSGLASDECKIAARKDLSYVKTIRELSKRSR